MLRYLRPLLFGLLAAVTIPVAFAADNCGGCKDYPGISRMPGYDITSYEESPFAAFDFPVTENGKQVKIKAEGLLARCCTTTTRSVIALRHFASPARQGSVGLS